MRVLLVLWVVSICLLCVPTSQAGATRIWSDKKGNTIEAEFVRVMGTKVILKTANGKTMRVPIAGLSAADKKFLANAIPPKLKILVDVDLDRETIESYSSTYGSYGWDKKSETVQCTVEIKKTNKDACSRAFKGIVYIFGQNLQTQKYQVLDVTEKKFDFKRSKETSFSSGSSVVKFTDSSLDGKTGWRYSGYLVLVMDDGDHVIASESGTTTFEKNIHRIRKAKKGDTFSKDFRAS